MFYRHTNVVEGSVVGDVQLEFGKGYVCSQNTAGTYVNGARGGCCRRWTYVYVYYFEIINFIHRFLHVVYMLKTPQINYHQNTAETYGS